MIEALNPLRELTLLSISLRMLLAVVLGGLVGLEREFKRRPAGFRTHILICLGAAITTLTSQYLLLELGYYADMARLGAQVVSGVGFIGAGTIIVTRRQRVKGLTTAAGLWVVAIIGLALGAGFYEGSILVVALVLFAELIFSKIEYRIMDKTQEMNIFMEYSGNACLSNVLNLLRENNLKLLDIEITRNGHSDTDTPDALFVIRTNRRFPPHLVLDLLRSQEGSVLVQEL